MLKTFHRFTHTTRFLRQHIQHLHTSFKLFSKTQEEDDDIVLDDPLDMELEDPTKPEKTTFWDTLWGSRTKDAGLLKYRYTHFYNNKPIPGPADDVQIPDTQNIRDGKRLFSMKCELITSAGKEHEFPKPGPPEIAFAGRSNVGKSSLINALLERQQVTKVSKMPGRTRRIFFYRIGEQHKNYFTLVDLPGYGYAEGNKKQIEDWKTTTGRYFNTRTCLMKALVLVDARNGRLTDLDELFMDLLQQTSVPHQIVLTKCDKIPHEELVSTISTVYQQIKKYMKCYPYVLTTSSIEKQGLDEVKGVIAMAAGIDERGVLLTGRAKKIRQMQEELKTQELKAKLEEAKKLREQKIKKTKKKLQQSVAKNVKAPFSVVVGLDDDDE